MRTAQRWNRRQMLKGSAAALGFPYFVPASALGKAGRPAPSDRIVIGCIGCGNRGPANMAGMMKQPDAQIVAVCDVRKSSREAAKATVDKNYDNQSCAVYADFRELCAKKEIDAVSIATPDHWHVLMALEAVRNRKHMYYEKPIGWSFEAGQVLRKAIHKSGLVFQFGTQQRSGRNFRYACELVRNGRIGKRQTILVGVPASSPFPMPAPEPVPEGFDYEMWLGPAPMAPYSYARCRPYGKQGWSVWYHISDYCMGFIGNWGIHHLDIAQWGHGTEDTGPVEIEGRGEFPKEGLANCALTWQVENKFRDGALAPAKNDPVMLGQSDPRQERDWEQEERRAISSTPQACGLLFIIRAGGAHWAWLRDLALPDGREVGEFVPQVVEVVWTDVRLQHLLDHRKEIRQRANRTQWRRPGRADQAPRGCQHQGVFDHHHGKAALVELGSQHPVRSAHRPHRARRFPVRLQDLANVFLLLAAVVHASLLSLAARAATDL
jgi:predicted dehydrogenase